MTKKTRYYVAGDGKKYRVMEAMTPFSIKVYREHCKKATIADPGNCLIALGARKHRNVLACYIGSGKDAYVIMQTAEGPVAFHYVISATAAKVRDTFDQDKKLKTQEINLTPPTAGRTLDHRASLNKKRRAEIKAGAEVQKRGKPRTTRIMRIGVPHRPRAQIVSNVVTVPPKKAGETAVH